MNEARLADLVGRPDVGSLGRGGEAAPPLGRGAARQLGRGGGAAGPLGRGRARPRGARRDVWVAGTLGLLLALTALGYLFTHPQRAELLVFLSAEIGGGREVSIPTGLALDLDWTTTAIAASLVELTSLFLLFPILVAFAAGLRRVRWLDAHLARARDFARRNPDVDVLALGALTFTPFLPVGALTSVLIGELLRLPSRYLLPVLAGALIAANVTMSYAMDRLISIFPRPELVAALMAAALALGALVVWLVHRARSARTRDDV